MATQLYNLEINVTSFSQRREEEIATKKLQKQVSDIANIQQFLFSIPQISNEHRIKLGTKNKLLEIITNKLEKLKIDKEPITMINR